MRFLYNHSFLVVPKGPALLKRVLPQIPFYGWILWFLLLVLSYYKQVWQLFVTQPRMWIEENYSLQVWVSTLHAIVTTGRLDWPLPSLDEAFPRAIYALFGAGTILFTAQILGAGTFLMMRWRPDNWVERILYRTALGLCLLSYLLLGLAGLGLYHPPVVVSLIVVVAVVGIGVFLSNLSFPTVQHRVSMLAIPLRGAFQYDRIWKLIALLALSIAIIGALAPEKEYDALWYHLWLPKLWLENGHPVDVVAEYISLYPLAWELLFGAAMVLGGAVAAKVLHFACLPLMALLVYQFSRRFVPLASPWLAVALFVTVPTVLWEATTAYVDLAVAFHVGLAVYALARYSTTRQWQWMTLACVNLGFGLAVKHLSLLLLALLVPALAVRLWLQDRRLFRATTPALLLAGVSLLFPLSYYIRALTLSGNPFFPELYTVFGAFPPERWNDITEHGLANFKNHFGDPRTLRNLLLLPWNMTVHAARYGGALGPLFLLLLPALRICRRSEPILWILILVLAYIALWASPISSFQMRFLIPITAFLAVLAAEAYRFLNQASERAGWDKRVICWVMAGLLLLNLPPFLSLHERDRSGWDGWLTHVVHEIPIGVVLGRESQEEYLRRTVPSYPAWHFINTSLPESSRILTFSGGDHFYSERERISDDATIARTITWGSSRGQETQALQALQKLEIDYILFNKRQLASLPPDTLAIAQPELMELWYERVFEDERFILFRVKQDHVRISTKH